ncbi:unnamed protein product [Umbelopsis ramanniana]
MIADFINYIPDTTIEEVDDESSSDEMDLEYTAKEYGEVIMLADAFTTTIDYNVNVNNKIIMKDSLATITEKKAPSVKYKKYGEDQKKATRYQKQQKLRVSPEVQPMS